jgi:tetratricopeptide (TPR) repeat protein
MREGDGELLRWREASMDPSALPTRAADLVDAARDAPVPHPLALARIYADLTVGGARPPARLRRAPLGLRLAALMALLLASAATAKGAMVLWHRYVAPVVVPLSGRPIPVRPRLASRAAPKPRVEPAPVIQAIEQRPAEAAPAPVLAEAPGPSRASEPAGAAASPRSRRASLAERHAPPGAAARGEGVEITDPMNEAQLLADAIARLRQGHDPRGALVLLDQYARTYPRGVLVSESRSARLETLLKLEDRAGALALLDERATFAGRLGAEQLVTRAELRASVGRYAAALGDFDRVLGQSPTLTASPADAGERALYGRAVTLGHLGRDDRARVDLEAYLRRFPGGKHTAEVARLLKGGSRPDRPARP